MSVATEGLGDNSTFSPCLSCLSFFFVGLCLLVLDFLKRPLEQYVRKLEVPVRVVRMEQRSGLIRARLKGASISTGQVCVCVCAHLKYRANHSFLYI